MPDQGPPFWLTPSPQAGLAMPPKATLCVGSTACLPCQEEPSTVCILPASFLLSPGTSRASTGLLADLPPETTSLASPSASFISPSLLRTQAWQDRSLRGHSKHSLGGHLHFSPLKVTNSLSSVRRVVGGVQEVSPKLCILVSTFDWLEPGQAPDSCVRGIFEMAETLSKFPNPSQLRHSPRPGLTWGPRETGPWFETAGGFQVWSNHALFPGTAHS